MVGHRLLRPVHKPLQRSGHVPKVKVTQPGRRRLSQQTPQNAQVRDESDSKGFKGIQSVEKNSRGVKGLEMLEVIARGWKGFKMWKRIQRVERACRSLK